MLPEIYHSSPADVKSSGPAFTHPFTHPGGLGAKKDFAHQLGLAQKATYRSAKTSESVARNLGEKKGEKNTPKNTLKNNLRPEQRQSSAPVPVPFPETNPVRWTKVAPVQSQPQSEKNGIDNLSVREPRASDGRSTKLESGLPAENMGEDFRSILPQGNLWMPLQVDATDKAGWDFDQDWGAASHEELPVAQDRSGGNPQLAKPLMLQKSGDLEWPQRVQGVQENDTRLGTEQAAFKPVSSLADRQKIASEGLNLESDSFLEGPTDTEKAFAGVEFVGGIMGPDASANQSYQSNNANFVPSVDFVDLRQQVQEASTRKSVGNASQSGENQTLAFTESEPFLDGLPLVTLAEGERLGNSDLQGVPKIGRGFIGDRDVLESVLEVLDGVPSGAQGNEEAVAGEDMKRQSQKAAHAFGESPQFFTSRQPLEKAAREMHEQMPQGTGVPPDLASQAPLETGAHQRNAALFSTQGGAGGKKKGIEPEEKSLKSEASASGGRDLGALQAAGLSLGNVVPGGTASLDSGNATSLGKSDTPHHQPLQRVWDQLSHAVGEGKRSITIALKPDQLGQIRVQIDHNRGFVALRFETQNPQAQALLQENMHELKATLQNRAVELRDVSFAKGVQGQTSFIPAHASGFDFLGGQGGNQRLAYDLDQVYLARLKPLIASASSLVARYQAQGMQNG